MDSTENNDAEYIGYDLGGFPFNKEFPPDERRYGIHHVGYPSDTAQVFYVTELLNPDALPLLDSVMLSEAIPDFDWYGGHSGMALTDRQAQKLDALWHKHITALKKGTKPTARTRENDKAYFAD